MWIMKRRNAFNILLLIAILSGFVIVLVMHIYYMRARAKIKRPNIVIIVSDALRKDHLGCYGYRNDATPNIDRFAKDATLFKNAFAQSPSTKPSVASLFTSRYPSQHSTIYKQDALNLTQVTLAEVLSEHNYLTAAFIENPVISGLFNYNQGFRWYELNDGRDEAATDELTADFDRKIFFWLKTYYTQPFFLYIHYIDPHGPYNAPAPFANFFDRHGKRYNDTKKDILEYLKNNDSRKKKRNLEHLISLYDDEVRYVDSRFKALIMRLENLNILDNSIVIFLSDHGEGFLEHGKLDHSYSLYSELINIPLIIRYPRLFKKHYEEKYVQQIDIFPTIMYILGIPSDALSLEGKNILSAPSEDIKIVSEQLRYGEEWGRPQRCIISKGWKLIQDIHLGVYSLFNIKDDPFDQKNLIQENTDVANKLKFFLSEWHKELKDKKESDKVTLDKNLEKKIRSLGYVQ